MASPRAKEIVIETIPVDDDNPVTPPRSPTPRTVQSEPGLSPISVEKNKTLEPQQKTKVTPQQKRLEQRKRRRQDRNAAIKQLLLGFKNEERTFLENEHRRMQKKNEDKIEKLEQSKRERRKKLRDAEEKRVEKKLQTQYERQATVRAKRITERSERLKYSRKRREENKIQLEKFKSALVPSVEHTKLKRREKIHGGSETRKNRGKNSGRRRKKERRRKYVDDDDDYFVNENSRDEENTTAMLLGGNGGYFEPSPVHSTVRNQHNDENDNGYDQRYHDEHSDYSVEDNDDFDEDEISAVERKRMSIAARHEALQREFNELLKQEETLAHDAKKTSGLRSTPKRRHSSNASKKKAPQAPPTSDMDDGDDFYAEEGDGSLVMKVPEKKNQEQSPISNTVSISRDTDEQLHRKIDRLSEQLRDTNKRNEIRVLRADSSANRLKLFEDMSKQYSPKKASMTPKRKKKERRGKKYGASTKLKSPTKEKKASFAKSQRALPKPASSEPPVDIGHHDADAGSSDGGGDGVKIAESASSSALWQDSRRNLDGCSQLTTKSASSPYLLVEQEQGRMRKKKKKDLRVQIGDDQKRRDTVGVVQIEGEAHEPSKMLSSDLQPKSDKNVTLKPSFKEKNIITKQIQDDDAEAVPNPTPMNTKYVLSAVSPTKPSEMLVGIVSLKDQTRILFDMIDQSRCRYLNRRICLVAISFNPLVRKLVASIPALQVLLYPSTFHVAFSKVLPEGKNKVSFQEFYECIGSNGLQINEIPKPEESRLSADRKTVKRKILRFSDADDTQELSDVDDVDDTQERQEKDDRVHASVEKIESATDESTIVKTTGACSMDKYSNEDVEQPYSGEQVRKNESNQKNETSGSEPDAKKREEERFALENNERKVTSRNEELERLKNKALSFNVDKPIPSQVLDSNESMQKSKSKNDMQRLGEKKTVSFNQGERKASVTAVSVPFNDNVEGKEVSIKGDSKKNAKVVSFNEDNFFGVSKKKTRFHRQGTPIGAQAHTLEEEAAVDFDAEHPTAQNVYDDGSMDDYDNEVYEQMVSNVSPNRGGSPFPTGSLGMGMIPFMDDEEETKSNTETTNRIENVHFDGSDALDLFAEADREEEMAHQQSENLIEQFQESDFMEQDDEETLRTSKENVFSNKTRRYTPDYRARRGPESSSSSPPVRRGKKNVEDELGEIMSEIEADSQKLQLTKKTNKSKTGVAEKKKKKKKIKKPKRKRARKKSSRSKFQVYQDSIQNMSPSPPRKKPSPKRSKLAALRNSPTLPNISQSPLPIEAYMRATEEKIKEQRRRLKMEKQRFRENANEIRRERERYVEYQRLERSPIRAAELRRRKKKPKKKNPFYGQAYHMDVRPGATVKYKKRKSAPRMLDKIPGRYSQQSQKAIPTFTPSMDYENSPIMDRDEYAYQRMRKQKAKQHRQQKIEEKWARKNEEILIKQLEEQKRIMNLRYKVAKERLEKRSKRGAVAADYKRPSFRTNESVVGDGMVGSYHKGISPKSMNPLKPGLERSFFGEKDDFQENQEGISKEEEFMEPTSLADLPASLFAAETVPKPKRQKGRGRGARNDVRAGGDVRSGADVPIDRRYDDSILPNINDVLGLTNNNDEDRSARTYRSPQMPN